MKILAILLLAAAVAGCATGSVRMVGDATTYKNGSCEILVYPTKGQAAAHGMTKELCVVEGSSAFSFDHSIEGAIKNNIPKVCGCGAKAAYISSATTESQMGVKGVSYVNLVGIR